MPFIKKQAFTRFYLDCMKKLLYAFLLTVLVAQTCLAESTQSGCTHPFNDIVGHWAEEDICVLYDEGVVQGYSTQTFLPDSEVTRAEFLKMVLKFEGYNIYSVQSAAFTDLTPGDWYYSYVTFAHSKGFVSGYSDGSFHPNEPIARAEAVTLVMKVTGISDYDTSDLYHTFTDVHETDWFASSVAAGVDLGIIQGYGDGTFRPYDEITRAEAAVIVKRAWKNL